MYEKEIVMEIKEYKNQLPSDGKYIRETVFIKEQQFKDEFDDIDFKAIHLVCYEKDEPIATARVFSDEKSGEYHIGRIAVLKPYRGKGIGAKIIAYAENLVKTLGENSLSLSAQERASAFYEKQGYKKVGDIYYDEYCPHIFMTKNLK